MTSSSAFDDAANFLTSNRSLDLPTQQKLEIYGLYKCVTVSPVPDTARPSFFDMTGRAKWDAWNDASKACSKDAEEAERRYIERAKQLGWKGERSDPHPSTEVSMDDDAFWDDEHVDPNESKRQHGGGLATFVSTIARPSHEVEERGKNDIHTLALSEDIQALQTFLQQDNVSINAVDEFGFTPLHLAADRGKAEVVEVLLKHGANPTLKDQDGYTAYELAEIAGHEDVLKALNNSGSFVK